MGKILQTTGVSMDPKANQNSSQKNEKKDGQKKEPFMKFDGKGYSFWQVLGYGLAAAAFIGTSVKVMDVIYTKTGNLIKGLTSDKKLELSSEDQAELDEAVNRPNPFSRAA